ncbi:MAG TPA: hypothetical protein VHW23_39245 [Kofleriaceae bacterium]|nr:hypothetical protein [Kofleriaceae bacterium]
MICLDSIGSHVRASRARLSWIAAAALAAALPLAQGCATDRTGTTDDGPTGELVLSLTQPGPHGEIYQLTSALFDVTTADGTTTTFDGSNAPQLVLSLPPGLASVFLEPGWTLQKSTDGGGTFQPVQALLGSVNPNGVRILANQPAFATYEFLLDETNGLLQISLGVITQPRELAGGFIVQSADGALADYPLTANRNMDFGVFFSLTSMESVTLTDGTKQRVYTAFSQGGSFGPIPPVPGAVAAAFYNDHIGTLAGPIAADLAAGSLTYTVAAHPDATITVSGSLIGGSTDIEFAPAPIDVVLPTIGADGFPDDVFFYAQQVPFTMTSADGTMAGFLRLRNIVPSP